MPGFTTTEVLGLIDKAVGNEPAIDGFKQEDIINFWRARYSLTMDLESGLASLKDLRESDLAIYQDIATFKLAEQKARSAIQYTSYAVKNLVSLLAIANFSNAIKDNGVLGGATATVAFSAIQFFINHYASPLVETICNPIVQETDEAAARLSAVKHYVNDLIKSHPSYVAPVSTHNRVLSTTGNGGVVSGTPLTSDLANISSVSVVPQNL